MTAELTLEDLANLSGLPLRTLRFYIQEGLLPGPDTHGKFSRYSAQHLDQIKMIQQLKSLRLPLSEIRHILNNMTVEEIGQLRGYQNGLRENLQPDRATNAKESPPSTVGSSALEYLRNLERGQENIKAAMSPRSPAVPGPVKRTPIQTPAPMDHQETWKRIRVNDRVEIHVRSAKDQEEERKISKLIEFAKKLFENR